MKQQLQKVQNAAAGFVLRKYANINDVTIYDNVPNHLKLMQKVAGTRNLQSNNKAILINANQQSETSENQTGNTFNKLPTNIRSVETLSVFKTKVKNDFLNQALARDFKSKNYVKELYSNKISKKNNKILLLLLILYFLISFSHSNLYFESHFKTNKTNTKKQCK